jgi:hypothetical protein
VQQWLIPFVSLFSAVMGAYLTYLFASRSQRDKSMLQFKEEKYAKLLVKMQGFVGETASGDLKREFFEEEYQSWLYASDDVIRTIDAMVTYVMQVERGEIDQDNAVGNGLVSAIVIAMRRDLMGKTTLEPEVFRYIDVGPKTSLK